MGMFLKVATFLEKNGEEQITISSLTTKMKEFLEETEDEQPYSEVYMNGIYEKGLVIST